MNLNNLVHFYTGGNEKFSENMCDQNLNDEESVYSIWQQVGCFPSPQVIIIPLYKHDKPLLFKLDHLTCSKLLC